MAVRGTRGILAVLFGCGLCGFLLGLLYPAWHLVVEGAQVAAGLVAYPSSNPYGFALQKSWTLLHQLPATLLSLGVSERILTQVLSGLGSALAFAALGLGVWALSEDLALSLLSPFAIAIASENFASGGLGYPSWSYSMALAGGDYGMFGFYGLLLVVGLIASGAPQWGLGLMGPLTAVHPGLGVWAHLIVLACAAVDRRTWSGFFRAYWVYAAAGYLFSAVSLWRHLGAVGPAPPLSEEVAPLLSSFLLHWDFHRRPFVLSDLYNPALPMAGLTVSLCLAWLRLLRKDLAPASLFLLRAFIAAAALGAGLSLVGWFCPGATAQLVLRFMPMRLIELDVLGLPVLILGLLGRYRKTGWARLTLAALAAALLLPPHLPGYVWFFPATFALLIFKAFAEEPLLRDRLLRVAAALLMAGGALILSVRSADPILLGFYSPARLAGALLLMASGAACLSARSQWWRVSPLILRASPVALPPWAPSLLLGLSAGMVFLSGLRGFNERLNLLRDWTDDPFWREAHRAPGLILTASDISFVQLRSRRPVLLNAGTLDMISYAPEAAPAINRILKAVYGVDILEPPEDIRRERPGALLMGTGRQLWEERSAEDWARLGQEFGFARVLTYAGWKLRLPEAARSGEFTLYRIAGPGT